MASTEPPAGSVPPDPNTPPPVPPPVPPSSATPPPPPPPPAPGYGAGPAPVGVGQPGSLVDRMVARILDHLVIGIPTAIVVAILGAASDSYVVTSLIAGLLYAGAYLGYFGFMESSRGQGVGKMVMKLKVVGPDGHSNPTTEQAIKRNLWVGAPVLYIIPILGVVLAAIIELVAILVCAININGNLPDRRTWFDTFAGGTQVIKIG